MPAMDRSSDLVQAVNRFKSIGVQGEQPSPHAGAKASSNTKFLSGSVLISNELDQLATEVSWFVKESQPKHLYDDSGMALATSSDNLKQRLDTMASAVQGLESVIRLSSSGQQRKHYSVVLGTLKTRFAATAKRFSETLQERTKALNSKKEKQSKRFGEAKVQLPNIPSHLRQPHQHHARMNPPGRPQPSSNLETGGGRQPEAAHSAQSGALRWRGMQAQDMSRNRNARFGGGGPALAAPPAFNPHGPEYEQSKKDDDANANAPGGPPSSQRMLYDRSRIAQQHRALAAQAVEKTISELSEMFNKVASLVHEQGESISVIDSNLDEAQSGVEAGQSELLKYFNNLSGERALIIKIFLVLICLGSFFIVWWR